MKTLRKAKGKGKVFSKPPCRDRRGGRGKQAIQLTRDRTPPAAKGNNGIDSLETQMTIRCRAEGSNRHMCNFKYKCQPYNAEIACYGVFHSSKTAKQSPSGRQTPPLCGQLETPHCRPVGTECCSGVSNFLPSGTKTGSGSSPLLVPSRAASPTAGRVGLTSKQGSYHSSGANIYSDGFLLHRILGSEAGEPVETGDKPQSPKLMGSIPALQDERYSHLVGLASSE